MDSLQYKMAQSDPEFQIKCQIISEVQQRPLLYNKGHPKYQISSCRNEEFVHIGVAVGKTGEYSLIHVVLIMINNFICHWNQMKSMYNKRCCLLGKEVAVLWKNLLDAYRKKVKSGSSGEPIDERAASWRYFDCMNFLKTFVGSRKWVINRFKYLQLILKLLRLHK